MTFTAFEPDLSPWTPGLLGMVFYVVMVMVLVTALLFLCSWLGEKKRTPEKARPYECGIIPSGSARFRYPVPFYLVAIFFIVFDVESAFIFAWATAWDLLGFPGLIHITFFIVVLLLGLVWLWLKGGLEWGPSAAGKHSFIGRMK